MRRGERPLPDRIEVAIMPTIRRLVHSDVLDLFDLQLVDISTKNGFS